MSITCREKDVSILLISTISILRLCKWLQIKMPGMFAPWPVLIIAQRLALDALFLETYSRPSWMGPWQPDPVPNLVFGNPVCVRGLELDDLWGSVQPKSFYDTSGFHANSLMFGDSGRVPYCCTSAYHRRGTLSLTLLQSLSSPILCFRWLLIFTTELMSN